MLKRFKKKEPEPVKTSNPLDVNNDGKVDMDDAKEVFSAVGNAAVSAPAKVWAKFVVERGIAVARYIITSRFGIITISTTLLLTALGGYFIPFVSYADAFYFAKFAGLVAGVLKS